MDPQRLLQQWINESVNIVFFGGAGVSTESGIPDFRSVDGLYRRQYDYPPETVISRAFFDRHPDIFFDFYRTRMVCPEARPNAAHLKLAELERVGRLQAVVTQNIDGLHQQAGSRKVWELHGSVHRNTCMGCGRKFTAGQLLASPEPVPRCPCGGVIKPDVVLYGEPLDSQTLQGASEAVSQAEMLIVGGTSLAVYPAAGLVELYQGRRLVVINRDATSQDERADLLIRGSIGEILGSLTVAPVR